MPNRLAILFIGLCIPAFLSAGNPGGQEHEAIVQRLTLKEKAPGQPIKFFDGFSIGGGIGATWFMGDLADHKILPKPSDWGSTLGGSWHAYARKEFIYGLGAKVFFEKGDLQGTRRIGDESPLLNFETQYMTFGLQVSLNLMEPIFGEEKNFRYYLNAEIGAGFTLYRSLTTWGEGAELIRDFEGYTTEEQPATQRYSDLDRDAMAQTFAIPVGLTFGYMLNHRVDVTANVTVNNLLTDRFETFARDRSAADKYAYLAVGVRYNFNRTEDDYPERKRKKKRDRDSASPNDLDLGDKLKPVKGFKAGKNRDEELLKAMTRMYELQLQLFQLQYLSK